MGFKAEKWSEINKSIRSSVETFKVPNHVNLTCRKSKTGSSIFATKVLQYIFIFYPGELTN